MKVDRNARSQFRNLEISRDELKEKLAELKARHASIEKNAQKEEELVRQRWNWRKNRLWAMWQERLDVLRKEREAIHAQLEHLLESISKEKATYQDKEGQLAKQSGELEQFVLHSGAANASERRQKEIQIELEKARIITQIKECESLIIDWQDRVKMTGAEISQRQENYREDLGFLDTLIKNEEREIDLFLNSFRKALGALGVQLDSEGNRQEAA